MTPEEFKELCQTIRKFKINKLKIDRALKPAIEKFKEYASNHKLEKGNHNGLKIEYRLTFAKDENVEKAIEEDISIPLIKSLTISDERIKELIDMGILKNHEIGKKVDFKKLEKIFAEKEIESKYYKQIIVKIQK